ncbi:hypothetical protein [Pseudomonas paraeruginosa]|uniref:hypothetical protein n=1 Tax=Pseudomonas paraeruginosa TaxID=2994495 RepID=UPI0012986DB6|nr:hypothetical protein [Pseudomonas paraeruginosa]
MFRQKIGELVLEYGRKWLFPDFTNKLTWLVAGFGGTIILTPTPLKLLFYSWIIDSANLNSNDLFNLAALEDGAADYKLGFSLIALSLLHNIAYRYICYQEKQLEDKSKIRAQETDKKLFEDFLRIFPSNSSSADFLRNQNLEHSFNISRLSELELFVDNWDNAEKTFLDPELEDSRSKLLQNCRKFEHDLSLGAYDLNGGPMYTCVPDNVRNEWDWPEHVTKKIQDLNALATKCYELHQELVLLGRRKLGA